MTVRELKTVLMVAVLFLFGACDEAPNAAHTEFRITAARADAVMTVDGLMNEAVWQRAQTVILRENRSGYSVTDSAVMTQVKSCYNESTLFIGFVCLDPDIWSTFTDRDEHLWEQEVVEVFLDTDQEENSYVEIEVSPANVLFDSYIIDPVNIDIEATKQYHLAAIQTAVSVDGTLNKRDDRDHRWTVEMAIPLAEIIKADESLVPGVTQWKINFYRVNADADGPSMGYAWSPTGARFHKPSAFGTLLFEK